MPRPSPRRARYQWSRQPQAAALLRAPLARRLRRGVRQLGRRRRGASPRASGAGRAARIPALAQRPLIWGSSSRRRAGARSAGRPRPLRLACATTTTATLAGVRALRARISRLLESSPAQGRRARTPSGSASRRPRSIPRSVWPVLGGRALARSARRFPRQDAMCFARVISTSKRNPGGMGAWTGPFRMLSCRNSGGERPRLLSLQRLPCNARATRSLARAGHCRQRRPATQHWVGVAESSLPGCLFLDGSLLRVPVPPPRQRLRLSQKPAPALLRSAFPI